MTLLRCIIVLQFATTLALGHGAQQTKPNDAPEAPETLVRSVYNEVVARHPVGIPEGVDMKIFEPYLSKTLLHRIDLARACSDDWDRQHPDPNLKPPFSWLESGLFSGDDKRTEPHAFHVERTQAEKDGSFRVYVSLTWEGSPEPPEIWQVAALVVRENGHFVVDDFLYLDDEGRHVEARLSEILALGCDGPRWVGYGTGRNLKRQK